MRKRLNKIILSISLLGIVATLAVLLVWQQLLVREQQHTYCAVSSATSSSEVKILTQLGLEVREGTNGQDAIVKGVSF